MKKQQVNAAKAKLKFVLSRSMSAAEVNSILDARSGFQRVSGGAYKTLYALLTDKECAVEALSIFWEKRRRNAARVSILVYEIHGKGMAKEILSMIKSFKNESFQRAGYPNAKTLLRALSARGVFSCKCEKIQYSIDFRLAQVKAERRRLARESTAATIEAYQKKKKEKVTRVLRDRF